MLFSPGGLLKMLGILFALGLFIFYYVYNKNKNVYAAASKFPGPRAYPILGNSVDFMTDSNGIFIKMEEFRRRYKRFFRIWNGGKLFLISYDPKDAEVLLSSVKELKKTNIYRYLQPWIGNGLVSTSDIPTWRLHRKIITPTFHFKILHDFLEVFNRNVAIMCELLSSEAGKGPFNVIKYAKLMALDSICETAMGVNMNAQLNSESDFVKAVERIANIVTLRFFQVWLMIDFTFNLSKYSKLQRDCLKILHGKTDEVIQQRRQKLREIKLNNNNEDPENPLNEHRRLAFLDLLLQSEEGSKLSDRELREEVDTFMFAGQDTVSAAMSFMFYCLADHPDVQEMAYNEQLEIMGDSNRSPTYAEIQEMKYLERVAKEVLRLYPSAPIIGRELSEDLELSGGYKVPKGSGFMINIYALHRDPNMWRDPEKFNPDNFLPEAIQSRSFYSYIPFSAGSRNCIGQKYAMLLIKAAFSLVLRKFKILPSPDPEHKPKLAAEITLVSVNGCHIQLELRN